MSVISNQNNGDNGVGEARTLFEGPSSGWCSPVRQRRPGRYPTTVRKKWNEEVDKVVRESRGKFCNNRAFGLFTFCTIPNQQAPFSSRDQAISRVESRSCRENHRKTTISTFGRREDILSKNL